MSGRLRYVKWPVYSSRTEQPVSLAVRRLPCHPVGMGSVPSLVSQFCFSVLFCFYNLVFIFYFYYFIDVLCHFFTLMLSLITVMVRVRIRVKVGFRVRHWLPGIQC